MRVLISAAHINVTPLQSDVEQKIQMRMVPCLDFLSGHSIERLKDCVGDKEADWEKVSQNREREGQRENVDSAQKLQKRRWVWKERERERMRDYYRESDWVRQRHWSNQ